MKDILIKWFMALNTFLIRFSGGHIGGQLGTQTILLLHTVGRKSGKEYVTPIAYFHLDGIYFIVASNWGKEKDAAWVHNLKAQPRTTIEVKGNTIPVEASRAEGSEYDRLWQHAVERHPPYLNYQKMTTRHIPIIIFRPLI
jgi:deazaflavin-dependent oxidoreductase (nitroreductase family)